MKMKHATWIAPRSAITVFRLLLISLAKISYEASYADIAYAVAVRLPTRNAFLSGTCPVGSQPSRSAFSAQSHPTVLSVSILVFLSF